MTSKGYLLPSPWCPDSTYAQLRVSAIATYAAATWPAADTAILFPVIFPSSCTLTALSTRGANTTGNYDLGFYLPNLTRIASTGSTAMASATLTLTLPEVRVHAGLTYFAALVCSSTSSSIVRTTTGDSAFRLSIAAGMGQQASALPLPNPFVPAVITSDYIPLFAFGVR